MRLYRIPLAAFALLMLSATTTASLAAQDAAPDPAQQAAEAARRAAESAAAPRFNPTTRRCENLPTVRDGRAWDTVVPREPAHPASFVLLTLIGGNWNEPVTVTVTAPDGGQMLVAQPVTQDGRLGTMYPVSPAVPGPESTVPGVYTVVWNATSGGTFLACDGFVVER